MLKKYLIIVLLLCILGSNSLWANHIFGYTIGIPVAVLGAGVVVADYIIETPPNQAVFLVGALLMAGGFSWALYDMFTHPKPDEIGTVNYSSQRKMNPIAEHLSFGIMPKQVYIGARFKF
jgi:hypothetical protein